MQKHFLSISFLIAILFFFPACSSGNDMVEDGFDILEKIDSVLVDSTSGDTIRGTGQTTTLPNVFKLEPFFR